MSAEEGQTDPVADPGPSKGQLPPTHALPIEETPGAVIGRYHLLQMIGEGGMGEVWLAEQKEPVRRRVAVKLIKAGMNTREVIARFESERQALALMDHPAIAKVLDAGSTSSGAPYFVMEYVAGIPITTYCDKHALGTRERLELFMRVCEGVQHAHQKAIIHRDLKPSNILVTEVDGKAAPKIIDFGVAKALTQKLTAETMFTRLGALIGTPEYMSPEQALTSGEDIDTRTDVYSLGIVFYELLSGEPPIDVRKIAFDEFLRKLREEDPPKPSTKIRTSDRGTSLELARKRHTEPVTLEKEIRGDLDSIALKALEKERSRRYASPSDFAADIGRHLKNEAVLAVPASPAYRLRKYLRRNWVGVTAATITLVAIGAGAAAALFEARVAQGRFDDVRRLAHSFVFDYHDQLAKIAGTIKLREQMVATALEYLDRLSRGAQNDISLQKELAAGYRKIGDVQGFPGGPNLGHQDQALASYAKAAALYEAAVRREPAYRLEICEFNVAYAYLLLISEKQSDAEARARTGLRCAQEHASARPDDEAAQSDLYHAYATMGDIDEQSDRDAYENYRQADQIARRILNRRRDEAALNLNAMIRGRFGTAAKLDGKLTEASQAYNEESEFTAELIRLNPTNPRYRGARMDAVGDQVRIADSDIAPSFEDPVAALARAREMLEYAKEELALDPNDAKAKIGVAVSLFQLSYPLKRTDPRGAVDAARESVRLFDRLLAEGQNSQVVSRRRRALPRLAESLLAAGQPQEAAPVAAELLTAERAAAVNDDPELKVTDRLSLALLLSGKVQDALGARAAAQAFLEEAEQMANKIHTHRPKDVSILVPLDLIRRALAAHYQKAGDAVQGDHWRDEARKLWREFPDQNEFVRRKAAEL
jgi:hypothetical protein